MSTIATLQYNPYSNREKKGYTLYTGYAPYVVGTFSGINFNPADGVNTELTLNTVSDKADYLLVLEGANNTIASRWFILDADRTRGGQYHLTLYRDVVYDNLPEVMGATAFIEKGWINDVSNPLLFNEEALPTNQRKIDEILIQDSTKTPWIVGYMPINAGINSELTVEIVSPSHNIIDITESTYNKLMRSNSYDLNDGALTFLQPMVVGSRQDSSMGDYTLVKWIYNAKESYTNQPPEPSTDYPQVYRTQVSSTHSLEADMDVGVNDILQALVETWTDFKPARINKVKDLTGNNVEDVKPYLNKYVRYNNNIYYFSIRSLGKKEGHFELTNLTQGGRTYTDTLNIKINNKKLIAQARGYNYDVRTNSTSWSQDVTYKVNSYAHVMQLVSNSSYHTVIPSDAARLHTSEIDNFSVFCMPWNDFLFKKLDNNYMTISGNIGRRLAMSISQKCSGSNQLYDLQLLPYCPIEGVLLNQLGATGNNAVDASKLVVNQAIPIYDNDNEIVSYYFWCTQSNFRFTKSITAGKLSRDIESVKIGGQTLIHRLCSPDASSSYEYNPLKILTPLLTESNRAINYNIYCTYKPYKPFIYIEVNSNGESLYGSSYTDGRGLICAGDFSLPQTNDAWATYQIQNKNYSNIFNRQIKSIELQNKYSMGNDIANAAVGAISGITGGATTGFAVGGPVGAVVGGIIGGIANTGAGIADVAINNTLRKDQLDLKRDLYQYNLENIQALPNTILNIGTLTDVNKLYPYIEVYDCTETEKQALYNKIKYNGMSIGVISEGLSEYITTDTHDHSFIKGQIIKIALHDDYHMLKHIRQEFETGFFINRGGN